MEEQPWGWVVWLIGLPASGKTTLARSLARELSARDIAAVVLDSDEFRRQFTPELTYTPADRDRFYELLAQQAVRLAQQGENVIIAATGNRRAYRATARTQLGSRFVEVWVRCPPEVCRTRDPKGLYARAAAGQITELPGVDAPFEAPEAAELIVDTDRQPPEEAAARILAALPFAQPGSSLTR